MRARSRRFIIGILLLLVALATTILVLGLFSAKSVTPVVTGKLSEADVREIQQLLAKGRAPLVSKDFSPKTFRMFRLRFRERLAGELISISSRDGEYADAVYRDSGDETITYDYDLYRTTNGWRIVGVGTSKKLKK
jgi:hypothetical protein